MGWLFCFDDYSYISLFHFFFKLVLDNFFHFSITILIGRISIYLWIGYGLELYKYLVLFLFSKFRAICSRISLSLFQFFFLFSCFTFHFVCVLKKEKRNIACLWFLEYSLDWLLAFWLFAEGNIKKKETQHRQHSNSMLLLFVCFSLRECECECNYHTDACDSSAQASSSKYFPNNRHIQPNDRHENLNKMLVGPFVNENENENGSFFIFHCFEYEVVFTCQINSLDLFFFQSSVSYPVRSSLSFLCSDSDSGTGIGIWLLLLFWKYISKILMSANIYTFQPIASLSITPYLTHIEPEWEWEWNAILFKKINNHSGMK